MGRAARAAESHTPGGHGVPLTVHKAFLPSSKKKKKNYCTNFWENYYYCCSFVVKNYYYCFYNCYFYFVNNLVVNIKIIILSS